MIARFAAAFGLFLSLAVAAPGRAAAQGAPVDTAAVLLDLAGKLETEGRLEAARMLYRLILERYPSAAAAGEARLRLGFVDRRIDVARAEQSGRTELLVWSTLYGLWLGVAVPAAFGAEDAEVYGFGLLVGGPTGFLLARSYARRHPLSVGQARAITFGGTWGTWQGFGWREVVDIGTETETVCLSGGCTEVETDEREAAFAAAVLGGLAGIGIGAALAGSREITEAGATVANFGALWGTWFGFAGGYLADLEDDELLAAALVGGDLGLIYSALSASRWGFSVSRARLISVAGVAGGLAGAGLDLLIQPDDEKVMVLIPTLTSALGLAAGVYWTRNHDSRGEGQDDPGAEALIRLRDGRLTLGMPTPRPTLLRIDGPGMPRHAPGIRVELFGARFH